MALQPHLSHTSSYGLKTAEPDSVECRAAHKLALLFLAAALGHPWLRLPLARGEGMFLLCPIPVLVVTCPSSNPSLGGLRLLGRVELHSLGGQGQPLCSLSVSCRTGS